MIVERAPLVLFADMEVHTVFGFGGTYCVKLASPVAVDEGGRLNMYHAFDLQQSRLIMIPQNARGFIIKGKFVEDSK